MLSNEEQAVGLQQPVGVGQRPRPVGKGIQTLCEIKKCRSNCIRVIETGLTANKVLSK